MEWNVRSIILRFSLAYSLHASDTIFIVDAKDRLTTVLVGRPNDPEWPKVSDEAANILDEVREAGMASNAFPEKYLLHRRGDFVAIPAGVSFGGGQKVPISSPAVSDDI